MTFNDEGYENKSFDVRSISLLSWKFPIINGNFAQATEMTVNNSQRKVDPTTTGAPIESNMATVNRYSNWTSALAKGSPTSISSYKWMETNRFAEISMWPSSRSFHLKGSKLSKPQQQQQATEKDNVGDEQIDAKASHFL